MAPSSFRAPSGGDCAPAPGDRAPSPRRGYNGTMRIGFPGGLRIGVIALGLAAAPLLVRALDRGLAGAERELSAGHLLLGLLVAAVAMPGPILGALARPGSGERLRGLAVGGAAVTALAALLAGAILYRRLFVAGGAGATEVLAFAWAVLALPLAALDFLRLRGGGEGTDPPRD
jgi:hypothetical protein